MEKEEQKITKEMLIDLITKIDNPKALKLIWDIIQSFKKGWGF